MSGGHTHGAISHTATDGSGHHSLGSLKGSTKNHKERKGWSAAEDSTLIDMMVGGHTWKSISVVLGSRTALACRLRYHVYLSGGKWIGAARRRLAKEWEVRTYPSRLPYTGPLSIRRHSA